MINALTIIGRITRTPELKKTTTGKSVLKMRIANEVFKGHSIFVGVVTYDHTAEYLSRYAVKGTMIAVNGYLDIWEDADKRPHTEIVANNVQIVSQPKSESESVSNEVTEYLNGESEELPW